MISFNKTLKIEKGYEYIKQAMENRKLAGDGEFTKRCHKWLEDRFATKKALLTTSCTHAIEMAAILLDIKSGDEIIAPSYTFVSSVNPFILRGGKIKFVDINPTTMNIDVSKIEQAITRETKAIVVVHYGGVACDMDKIQEIAKKYNLYIVEDAAQGVMATYKGKFLGTIGDIATYSFHETKNYTMGEGGALLINNLKFIDRAEIIREKGTNRSRFFRGEIDKYTWVDIGSSYLPSEMNAAYLYAQLEIAEEINNKRLEIWNRYYDNLKELEKLGKIELAVIPDYAKHNGHLFYIKLKDINERGKLIKYLKENNIHAVFHYVPLHSSPAGKKYGAFIGEDIYTSKESERLLRLPLYYDLSLDEVDYITDKIKSYFK
jgi:dTDP-4-amino-4,6-dideoxygalactose transaminase